MAQSLRSEKGCAVLPGAAPAPVPASVRESRPMLPLHPQPGRPPTSPPSSFFRTRLPLPARIKAPDLPEGAAPHPPSPTLTAPCGPDLLPAQAARLQPPSPFQPLPSVATHRVGLQGGVLGSSEVEVRELHTGRSRWAGKSPTTELSTSELDTAQSDLLAPSPRRLRAVRPTGRVSRWRRGAGNVTAAGHVRGAGQPADRRAKYCGNCTADTTQPSLHPRGGPGPTLAPGRGSAGTPHEQAETATPLGLRGWAYGIPPHM